MVVILMLVGAWCQAEAQAVPPPPSISITPVGPSDLGPVDAGTIYAGKLVVSNQGTRRFMVSGPQGISRVWLVPQSPIAVNPGDVTTLDFRIEAHGLDGTQSLALDLRTDDPGAPLLEQVFTLNVVRTTDVRPYRDTLVAERDSSGVPVGSPRTFEFLPGPNSGEFVSAVLEDSTAPLTISWSHTPAGGILGTLSIDQVAILNGAPLRGETRVLGVTKNGNRNFITYQWLVK